jgi:hypothetical protein
MMHKLIKYGLQITDVDWSANDAGTCWAVKLNNKIKIFKEEIKMIENMIA